MDYDPERMTDAIMQGVVNVIAQDNGGECQDGGAIALGPRSRRRVRAVR